MLALIAVCLIAWPLVLPFADGALHAAVRWGLDCVVYSAAAASCLVRAVKVERDRVAWGLIGAGITCYALGTIPGSVGATAFAHAGWLAFYPLAYAGVVVLARATLRPFTIAFALDGLLAALALAAVATVVASPSGDGRITELDMAIGLAYAAGDLLLFGFTLWVARMAGWGVQPMWRWLTLAFAVLLAGDLGLMIQTSVASFDRDSLITVCFPVAMACMGLAAWRPRGAPRVMRPRLGGLVALPAVSVAVACLLLLATSADRLSDGLALAVLALATVRMLLVYGHLASIQGSLQFRRGFDEATVGMALLDANLRWVRVNGALADLLGVDREALTGAAAPDVFTGDPELGAAIDAAFSGGEPLRAVPARLRRPDGATVEVEVTGSVVEGEQGEPQLFAQARDVTAERKADRWAAAVARLTRLALDEPRVSVLMREAAGVIADALPARGCVVLTAERDAPMAGLLAAAGDADPSIGIAPLKGTIAASLERGRSLTVEQIEAAEPFVPADAARLLTMPVLPTGAPRSVIAAYRGPGTPAFAADDARFLQAIANVLTSAQERAAAEDEQRHRALHDPLTGLANRALLADHLRRTLANASRRSGRVALLLVDLDRFKSVNDTLGHRAGDNLLLVVADRLREHARGGDLVARLGGDEFVVVFDEVESVLEAVAVARRIIEAMSAPVQVGGRELVVSASVGVVLADDHVVEPDVLLRDADVAMYRAKAGGGGRHEVFDAELRAQVIDRLAIESDLRQGINRGELVLHLQPLIDLRSRRPLAFEALVRWERPGRGLVPPGDFIGLAEDTGLIEPIGRWVLQRACAQVASLNQARGTEIGVSVNVSARQITEDLIADVRAVLADTGLPARLLTLEITESLVIEERGAYGVLQAVRDMGVTLALDDFGTGFSSLGALQRHRVDELKLDRTMVDSVPTSTTAAAIARATVQMAGALGLGVVAEGIEDARQLQAVAGLGCHVGQGFLFGRPMPAADIGAYLDEGSWTRAFTPGLRG